MKRRLFYCFIPILLGSISCQEVRIEKDEFSHFLPIKENVFGVKVILGEKLNNPYSLSNMQEAYAELIRTRAEYSSMPCDTLSANWLYVRFLPKDSTDLAILDSFCLDLFDYPLDYDILVYGDSYHDPSLPDDQFTWQYTCIRPDFVIPNEITYEVLEECFIPEDDLATRTSSFPFYQELEKLAFNKAGIELDDSSDTRASASEHCPSGVVKIDQNGKGTLLPVKGVKVKCNVLVKIGSAYTDQYGNYYITKFFYSKPHYHLEFENTKDFTIWAGLDILSSADVDYGKQSIRNFNITIKQNEKAWNWATINNAGYDYYNKCKQLGIPQPHSNFKIMVFTGKTTDDAWGATPMLRRLAGVGIDSNSLAVDIISNIVVVPIATVLLTVFKLGCPDQVFNVGWMQNKYYEKLYYLAWHEFSHASHFEVAGREYWQRYASSIMTHGFSYGSKTDEHSGIIDLGESWALAFTSFVYYTIKSGVLYYDEGTFDSGESFNSRPLTDLMEGYILSPSQILNCMKGNIRSIYDLKDTLLKTYPSKKSSIENTFKNYGL